MQRVLPIHHFHVVFTLPAELAPLAKRNPTAIHALLMRAAADSLLALGQDKRFWGIPANLGVTAVLHTWTRDMRFHPHVHCIVTGGGLDNDGLRWVSAPADFLFPVHVLGALFRGKILSGIAHLLQTGAIVDSCHDRAARRRRKRLYQKSWVVYCKRPFGGPSQVFQYLGRYTHRVAISNARLVSATDDAVVFRTRGQGTCTLHPHDFIHRFLQHVLPSGFVKIRHFGLLASANVNTKLVAAQRALRGQSKLNDAHMPAEDSDHEPDISSQSAEVPVAWQSVLLALTGIDVSLCPRCHARAVVRVPLDASIRGPPSAHA